MLIATEPFLSLAEAIARQEGFDHLPIVTIPHPIGGVEPASLDETVLAATDRIAAALVTSPSPTAGVTVTEAVHEAPADIVGFLDFAAAHGWSDGLPLVPPTVGLVDEAIAGAGLPPDEVLGAVPPSNRGASVRAVATNAVMAGCTPELMPVVIAAVRAALDPRFNLQALTTTTHPVTPLIVVHGPVATSLGFNGGANTFGQGNRANATVGRALRLVMQNVGGAKPGETDRATHGSPTKYSYCMAENAAESPIESFHDHRGGGADGAVTVIGGEGPHNVNDHGSTDARGLFRNIAGTMATLGCNNLYLRGQMLIVLSPEHAAVMARDGYDRRGIQQALYDMAWQDVSEVSEGNMERFRRISPQLFENLAEDGRVRMLDRPEDALVIVAGGPGKHSVVVPTFGATEAITVDLAMP